ncbi:SH3 domain-containing protein [Sulfitobacter pseudonitzschiae]|uniref:SH3 domain-containing protein n=1 Tax=Pseudosulfitobacter pseudonitzschiae TaxID=1402135 RepID=A0A9Q2NU60_9RHOB|nr:MULTISPECIES: SH3 domain-containing protein [Roseobacteraceae]MBM2294393.1 SH3 domain-containing protein [Pseudosulfitobacter pseudonitzschiae]MBM2299318.1 SH3 domain-containing protein [Pseudosulfitobacter pseudonitzschiae]MBM2304225.1 SH3 domain-containing protein [Pseudosulfitobacter pseudonitzschiae]MBM2314005.1 SH3 domain-containing protein [Pseudosulfitobacter pseudonitzschiae]MBM2318920.1 SH3 domain-containing protein [Pseudosulfitobacter pseudonitzschiae]|tara:strand:+ start:601 stop:903 length:303 start_codon:yes stop_codon:yes gene_type:complete
MRKAILLAVVSAMLATLSPTGPAMAASLGDFEVTGVDDDDMLKMRAGPGTGYKVILGLPNGTVLRVHSCTQTGGTRWCEVSLKAARAMKGHVSWAYLRKH